MANYSCKVFPYDLPISQGTMVHMLQTDKRTDRWQPCQ